MTRLRFALILALATSLSSELTLAAPTRSAANPAASRSTPRRAPARSTRKAAPRPAAAKSTAAKPAAAAAPQPAEPAPPEAAAAEASHARTPASGTSEAKVTPTAPTAAAGVVRTEEAEKGVKTYTFGAEEVEGRLRSPQILYFLRRVRAEFDAEPLGHRSFLLELSDTRRAPSLE
jgi:hypothetical protein